MKSFDELARRGLSLRLVGFDDGPFERAPGARVPVSGVVCRGVRLDGMVFGWATRDGDDGAEVIASALLSSRFHAQVHGVLLDGVTVGGLNVIDLPALAERLDRPCVAVMRRPPDLAAMRRALAKLPDAEGRLARLERAGVVHQEGGFVFQVVGESPAATARALAQVTDRGKVPEPLRLAHLINGALTRGESGRRA
ncbi:DUF99 family protein [Myxococcota bacterium]|nr:DUF99 family protein [Myxococcota bacterium]